MFYTASYMRLLSCFSTPQRLIMKAIFFVIALLGVLVWQSARVHSGVLPPPAEPEPTVWNNDPVEEDVYVDCPCGYALYRVRSEFSDGDADRQWLWECRKVGSYVYRIAATSFASWYS